MKFLILIFLFFFSFTSISQEFWNGVLDAHKITERFFVANNSIYFNWDNNNYLMVKNMPHIKIDNNNKEEINSLGWTVTPYSLLLNESNAWVKRVYRDIPVKNNVDEQMYKGSVRVRKSGRAEKKIDTSFIEEQSLLNTLKKSIENGNVIPYVKTKPLTDLIKDKAKLEFLTKSIDKTKFLRLKEDWYYDRKDGKLKSSLIGLAILNELNEEVFWVYYPEFDWVLRNTSLRNYKNEHFSWSEFLKSHNYKSKITKEYNLMTYSNSYETNSTNPYSFHRTDYNSLFMIELINEAVVLLDFKELNYSFSYTNLNDMKIKGEIEDGVKQGKWTVLYSNGDVTSVVFKNSIPHGIYHSKFKNGETKEKGNFEFGLKDGEWKAFYESGELMSVKNLKAGWYKGKQEVWFENGIKHLEYNFSNQEINDYYIRKDESGIVLEEGSFKDGFVYGKWNLNIPIPNLYKEFFMNNLSFKWGFDVEKVCEDGYFSYSTEIVHEKSAFCPSGVCVSTKSDSEVK